MGIQRQLEKEKQNLTDLKRSNEEKIIREKLQKLDIDFENLTQKEESIQKRILEIRARKAANRKELSSLLGKDVAEEKSSDDQKYKNETVQNEITSHLFKSRWKRN